MSILKTGIQAPSVKVMVFGTFDLLHKGHLYFLNEAKKHGTYLVVVVARDDNVRDIKRKIPCHDESSRMDAIKKTRIADKVILGEKKFSFNPIIAEKPDMICLGYDQDSHGAENRFPKIKFVRIKAFKPERYKSSKMKCFLF